MESVDSQTDVSNPIPTFNSNNNTSNVDPNKLQLLQSLTNIFDKPRPNSIRGFKKQYPSLYIEQEKSLLKSRFRFLVSLVGILIPPNLLFNGITLNSHWVEKKYPQSNNNPPFIGVSIAIYAAILPSLSSFSKSIYKLSFDYYGAFIGSFVSLVIAGILLYDLQRTKDFTKFGSGLSIRQKKLALILGLIYLWNLVGAGLMMLMEGYVFSESLYFCLASISTIGFGDLHPTNNSSRAVLIAWFVFGLIITGMYSLDASEVYRQMVYIHKIGPQESIFRKKYIVTNPLSNNAENQDFHYYSKQENYLDQNNGDCMQNNSASSNFASSSSQSHFIYNTISDKINNALPQNINNNQCSSLAEKISTSQKHLSYGTSICSTENINSVKFSCSKKSKNSIPSHNIDQPVISNPENTNPIQNSNSKNAIPINSAVSPQNNLLMGVEKLDNFYNNLKVKISLYLFVGNLVNLFVNAAIFYGFEKDNWSMADSIYFCFISFTTIGYGDKTLTQSASRTYFSLTIIFSVSLFSTLFVLLIDQVYGSIGEKMDPSLHKHSEPPVKSVSLNIHENFCKKFHI
ncbi:hypothetical protein AYI68_g1119 [Smittium mucronatum]|uniref:Potassium channel domain-containing protein n=1 Tax=Smittium mucronatum TaxID=133383 RepID=A0A1R0H6H1_9FUNG|nr:hypothetical protein AYI68_g1119 [Smittium mucronatum]